MRNMKLVDAVVALHEIAKLVQEECGDANLDKDIRNCAERLHLRSIQDGHVNNIVTEIIKQAKE